MIHADHNHNPHRKHQDIRQEDWMYESWQELLDKMDEQTQLLELIMALLVDIASGSGSGGDPYGS